MKRIHTILLSLLICGVAVAADEAAVDTVSGAWYQYPSELAADGYDVVAYFSEANAVPGSADYTHEYGGQVWRFKNDENRRAFAESPAQYAPQYGGYCAYAVAQDALAFGDPLAWTVHDGRLYFNFSSGVRTRWERRAGPYVEKSDRYWQGGLQQKALARVPTQ